MSREVRSYTGQHVIVTGGVSGFGKALVERFAADGATVLAVDLHDEAPAGSLPAGVLYRRLDVRDLQGWAELHDWVEQTWGRLDVLVSNAGIGVGGRIEVTEPAEWDRALSINLMGVVHGVRTFVPMMKARGGGQLVNTASLAGLVHAPGMAAYNVVKAGVVALSETLLFELAPFGIAVTVICPSFFRTDLTSSLAGADADVEATAVDLIQGSPRSADQVADRAFPAMQQGEFLVLTDIDGHVAHRTKRLAWPAYARAMKQTGANMGRPGNRAVLVRRLARVQRRLQRDRS